MATDVEIGRNFLETLVAEYIRGENIDPKRVSMAKAYLGEMVNRVAYHALQLHGGYGYMEEYKISRIYRDVRALSILAGTTEIMKLIIARSLGLKPVNRIYIEYTGGHQMDNITLMATSIHKRSHVK